MRQQKSAVNENEFRELRGDEAMVIFAKKLQSDFIEILDSARGEVLDEKFLERIKAEFRGTGKYEYGSSFPVAMLESLVKVKVLPNEREPKAHVFVFGEQFRRHGIGMGLDTAVDKLREEVGLEVKQTVKTDSGYVVSKTVDSQHDGYKYNGEAKA